MAYPTPAVAGDQVTATDFNDFTLNPSYTYGETIAAGDVLYLKASDGKVYKADHDVSASLFAVVAVAITAGVANDVKSCIPPGKKVSGASGLTAGSPVFLSNTAGAATATVSALQIGLALSTTTYLFYPETRRIPSGLIMVNAGSSTPSGWLLCDGTAVSRTTYAELFAVISTTYGVGDGSTTFNLPDLKGRVAVGLDSGQTEFDTLGETGGAKTHTLSVAEIPAHTHTQPTSSSGAGTFCMTVQATPSGTSTSSSTGGGGAHNNLQPYIVMHYVIKV